MSVARTTGRTTRFDHSSDESTTVRLTRLEMCTGARGLEYI